MNKHYAFIPMKDRDLSSFRKSLLASLSPRPVCAVLALVILGFTGYFKLELLMADTINLLVFSLAVASVLYLLILEMQKIITVAHFRKSSLLPYIHVRGLDSSFYIEEIANGFIIQIAPVNQIDITNSIDLLTEITSHFPESIQLAEYLDACINSGDHHLISKAVIYIEIVHDQLEKGNKEILATYDKLVNFKEDFY